MQRGAREMRGNRHFLFTNLKAEMTASSIEVGTPPPHPGNRFAGPRVP